MWQVAGPLTGKAFWIAWTSSDWQSSLVRAANSQNEDAVFRVCNKLRQEYVSGETDASNSEFDLAGGCRDFALGRGLADDLTFEVMTDCVSR
jgi:hypothetical protein